MFLGQTDFQISVRITNDYRNLIPLGTLLYIGIPSDFAFQGVRLDTSSWNRFDAEFLHDVYGTKLHSSLQALIFLIRHRFFSATYKLFPCTIGKWGQFMFWKVRVYAVPLDIEGSRFLRLWRNIWLNNQSTLHKRAKVQWHTLLSYLDFSRVGWSRVFNDNISTVICILFFAPSTKILNKPQNTFHHMRRWSIGEGLSGNLKQKDSLENVVQDIYEQIQTPNLLRYTEKGIRNFTGVPSAEEAISLLLRKNNSNSSSIKGLTSVLYPFQLRSVCKMYEKESVSLKDCVPHFIKFTSPTGSPYYYDILGHGFYLKPELYTSPKGGILAENMGLGKTLICLALICLTKHEISVIPEDLLLHEFPESSETKKLKTLAEISLASIAQNSLPWKYFTEDLPPSVIEKLNMFPGKFYISLNQNHGALGLRARNSLNTISSSRKLILTSSTLVVVPENLLHQWNDEAIKHVDARFLRKLFLSERFKSPIHHDDSFYINSPPTDPKKIMTYDLIVISVPLFSKIMIDPENVFMKIYWKRLIIDEGHSMSSRTSNLSLGCKLIHSERRWVVTGTPTSGLTNLHMEEDELDGLTENPRKKRRKYIVKGKFNVREDLSKLGSLVSNYFKIEPFHSQPGLWTSSILKNLSNSNQLTAKLSLQNLLNSLLVRHSQSQVEADLVLPQLHHEAIFLEPSYQNKLAINLFTSVLAVNAVSSERVGGDYMFDSSNRQQLQRLVSNLQLSTFYWTGFQVLDVKSLASIAKHCLQKKTSNGEPYYNFEDRKLLESSLSAVKRALGNPRWKAAAMLHEMQLYVANLPHSYTSNFGTGSIGNIGVYGAPQLNAVQKFFYKNRFLSLSDPTILDSKLKESSKSFWKEYWRRSEKKETGKFSKADVPLEFDSHTVREEGGKAVKIPIKRDSIDDYLFSKYSYGNLPSDSHQSRKSFDPKLAQILGTASSKLSYLASKLVSHQKKGIKSIVFFEYEDSAYYLTELLDILGVNYILYATFIGAERRPNNLNDFASYDSMKKGGVTLIMDLKLAAHGLTVIAATRVYFINPVWHRSIEAQAIKRAHRIGQTHEVFVETLVLRGTLEEEIYRRRLEGDKLNDIKDEETQKKYVIDDTGMQQFVLKHEFLPVNDAAHEYASFSETISTDSTAESGPSPEQPISEFSLPVHSSEFNSLHGQTERKWIMRVFSEANLQKLGEAKQSRIGLEQLNVEIVEGKPQISSFSRPKKATRKSVRF